MTAFGALSTIATLAFPFAVRSGFVAVFIMRALQGIGASLSSPLTGLIASQWSTTKSAGTFVAILSCHSQFCTIFTMPVAGALCETSLGWPSVYYLQGTMSVFTFLAFFLFYRDNPREHRYVSPTELAEITKGKQGQEKGDTPYRAIATDSCILAIWISDFGTMISFQTFFLYGPTYINKPEFSP
uniref:MFS domain-containing protein n=1 Tax=Haemonchus contortus TaxID=6289 RepID=A0A7I4Y0U1_HAECO